MVVRVETPYGLGELVGRETRTEWIGMRPRRRSILFILFDDQTTRRFDSSVCRVVPPSEDGTTVLTVTAPRDAEPSENRGETPKGEDRSAS